MLPDEGHGLTPDLLAHLINPPMPGGHIVCAFLYKKNNRLAVIQASRLLLKGRGVVVLRLLKLFSNGSNNSSVGSYGVVGQGVNDSNSFFSYFNNGSGGVDSFASVFSLVTAREKRSAESYSEN